ncbi:MAG: flagellar hook-basal body protein [Clostridia bacterium]|nr:flagellar hook-basal body protein [Clostridia bacterium]
MINAYYTVSNSMMTQQKVVDAIAGNIANVNTSGYKKVEASFKDMLYSTLKGNSDEAYQLGNGISIRTFEKDLSSGVLVKTDSLLDFAIDGKGFFKVGSNSGEMFYSRGGNFTISVEPGGSFITDGNGLYLLDENNQKIKVEEESGTIGLDNSGLMSFENSDSTYQLQVVNFENPGGLNMYGSNLFTYSQEAGKEINNSDVKIMQSFTENSNVNLATEMTQLIKVQRLYEMNSKLVQVIDEIQGLANRLRR